MIQKATLAQFPQIMDIYAQARVFMAQNGNPDQWGTTDPPEWRVLQDIQSGKCYVNLIDDAIAGVFYFAVEEDPTYDNIEGAWPNDRPYGVVHRIAVGEQGRGVAAQCLAFAYARCGNLRIDTHEKNIPMRNCLAKNGFVCCGTIYVEDGTPRLAYQKE